MLVTNVVVFEPKSFNEALHLHMTLLYKWKSKDGNITEQTISGTWERTSYYCRNCGVKGEVLLWKGEMESALHAVYYCRICGVPDSELLYTYYPVPSRLFFKQYKLQPVLREVTKETRIID